MSDSLIPFQPAMDEPSNIFPSVKKPSSTSRVGMVTCCSLPRVSVKRRSANLASFSLINFRTSAGVICVLANWNNGGRQGRGMSALQLVCQLGAYMDQALAAGGVLCLHHYSAWRSFIRIEMVQEGSFGPILGSPEPDRGCFGTQMSALPSPAFATQDSARDASLYSAAWPNRS